jgi:DNA-directed RNA polymerase specialized sigma24 family protein
MKKLACKRYPQFPPPAVPRREDEVLVQLYLVEKQSIRELAQSYSCSQATIRKRLARLGAEIRLI